jgi:hypothetical protein
MTKVPRGARRRGQCGLSAALSGGAPRPDLPHFARSLSRRTAGGQVFVTGSSYGTSSRVVTSGYVLRQLFVFGTDHQCQRGTSLTGQPDRPLLYALLYATRSV